ncbi:RB38B [Auxenochlorella protothecoides x Auxenochlorella symbiontica]
MMRYALSLLACAAPTARVAGGMRHAAALHTSRAHLHTPTQHMLSSWRQRGVESSRRAAFASQSEGRVAPLEEVPYNKDKYNTVSLIGNLGGDVDLRYLESGSKTATMAMAVSRKTKPAFWVDVVVWNELAEAAAQGLRKGSKVEVEGYLTILDTAAGNRKAQVVARAIRKVIYDAQGQGNDAFPSSHESAPPHQSSGAGEQASPAAKQRLSNEEQDQLWMNLFENPSDWLDYRGKKESGSVKPRHPDFKLRNGGLNAPALWISSSPAWVKSELHKLDSQGQLHTADTV